MALEPIYELREPAREQRQPNKNGHGGIFIPISPMIAEKEASFAARVKTQVNKQRIHQQVLEVENSNDLKIWCDQDDAEPI